MPAKKEPSAKVTTPSKNRRGRKRRRADSTVAAVAKVASTGRVRFPVVGIGASAGGLDAFKRFFSAMPANPGIAFVLIPHLDPTHRSPMVELLSRQTAMKVSEVTRTTSIEPNCVYIIPSNKSLSMTAGRLRLGKAAGERRLQTAIDPFFRSLAEDQQEKAIGIVLSGTGSHGTPGLKEIKLLGGMVMVQDPTTAEYDQMPRNAIQAGIVDYVLPPEKMPEALLNYVRRPYLNQREPLAESEAAAEQIGRILELLRERTKYDFRSYRKQMLQRRIQRRMGLCHIDTVAGYLAFLHGDPREIAALCKDLLIGFTSFFREPAAFEVLKQQVIPDLVERAIVENPIRVWVPGCATGEEAYSIAMLLLAGFSAIKKPPSLQVFATDIDEKSLEVARHGVYTASGVADLPPEYLSQFFVKVDDNHFRASEQLRESFAVTYQNIISDSPFSRLDLISCRNVLMYLEPAQQSKTLSLFHFALKTDGYLFLGRSESIGRHTDLFEPLSKKWQIYRRRGPTRRDLLPRAIAPPEEQKSRGSTSEPMRRRRASFAELTQRLLAAKYAPASVLINRKYEVLSLFGPTSIYLELHSGEPTLNLLAMARKGLRHRIRTVCDKVIAGGDAGAEMPARVSRNGSSVPCVITATLLREPEELDGLLLVTFLDQVERPDGGKPIRVEPAKESAVVRQLEYELQTARVKLQSAIEELQSSNEEVMSINEELQSANEELETSKEELQSFNEELLTVNSQLQEKVDALDHANNDIRNLLNSTQIAMLFLGTDLRIRRFTPAIKQLLNLMESDSGRPIRDFALTFAHGNLIEDARLVLKQLLPIDREVRSPEGRCWIRRIFPYRTEDNRIEGVAVAFLDITEGKRVEDALAKSEERMRAIVDTAADAIITSDDRGIIDGFNPAAEKMFGYSAAEVIGQNVAILMPQPHRKEHDSYISNYIKTGIKKILGTTREVLGQRKDGSTFPTELSVTEFYASGARKFAGVHRDVSERKALQRELLTIVSEEHHRIGQDLHDNIGQELTGLGMLAGSLTQSLEEHAPQDVEAARRLAAGLERTLEQVRRLSRGLVPVEIDAESLTLALRDLAERTSRDSGVRCDFDGDKPAQVANKEVATHLYRIAQEAVTNALKHGSPRHVQLSLEDDENRILLVIRDDGAGMPSTDWKTRGMGLKTMRYRAALLGATLSVTPAPSGGTLVTCYLPRIHDHAKATAKPR
jgi:two-component system, chemotaxis family, CheB/CheR fusion protein